MHFFSGDKIMNNKYMNIAIKEAYKCRRTEDFPVGCIIEKNGKIISKAHNKRNKSKLTMDHAEIIAIKKANKRCKEWRLNECNMYVTLEPCNMCMSIIKEARIDNVYYLINIKEQKKQYNKVNFEHISLNNLSEKEYHKMITSFFNKMR